MVQHLRGGVDDDVPQTAGIGQGPLLGVDDTHRAQHGAAVVDERGAEVGADPDGVDHRVAAEARGRVHVVQGRAFLRAMTSGHQPWSRLMVRPTITYPLSAGGWCSPMKVCSSRNRLTNPYKNLACVAMSRARSSKSSLGTVGTPKRLSSS